VNLRIVTHAERPSLRGKLPDLWPQFMHHDAAVSEFWPQLYEVYPDFQLWVLDSRRLVGYACTLPVVWNGDAPERGIDWAVTEGVGGTPTTLCAMVAGIIPQYRGRGISSALLVRMGKLAAAHGFDALGAPVRPTWKERYPLTPIERYVEWRREDGLPYDPWLRTHERLGGDLVAVARRSMTVTGSREEWEEWTGLQFPEDGDYVVPGALCPVRFDSGAGTYAEPNVWFRHVL